MPGIDIQSSVEASKEKPSNSSPTMIQKAKDLVRKVILPVPLSPLDVATKDTIQDNVDNPGARFKPSKESLKLITQLVDVTALSR